MQGGGTATRVALTQVCGRAPALPAREGGFVARSRTAVVSQRGWLPNPKKNGMVWKRENPFGVNGFCGNIGIRIGLVFDADGFFEHSADGTIGQIEYQKVEQHEEKVCGVLIKCGLREMKHEYGGQRYGGQGKGIGPPRQVEVDAQKHAYIEQHEHGEEKCKEIEYLREGIELVAGEFEVRNETDGRWGS